MDAARAHEGGGASRELPALGYHAASASNRQPREGQMSEHNSDRRTLLKNALTGLVALPAAGLVRDAAAQAAMPKLDEKDTLAVAMGYVHDAKKVDANKVPQFKPNSKCSNCMQIQGKDGEQWRPCTIFPGKLVAADGWCKVWVQKPGAK
jgi:hypothetical protein